MHGKDLAPSHLPWAHATMRALTGMKQSDAVEASILALQTILKQLNPAYEWIPETEPSKAPTTQSPAPAITRPPYTVPTSRDLSNVPAAPNSTLNTTTLPAPAQSQPLLYDFQGNPLEQSMDMPATTGGTGSGEDLLDFTLADMGWDFDFSTMDLETFFSVSPAFDAPAV